MGCRARDHNGPIKYQVINNDFAFVSRHKVRILMSTSRGYLYQQHKTKVFTLRFTLFEKRIMIFLKGRLIMYRCFHLDPLQHILGQNYKIRDTCPPAVFF